MYIWKPWSKIRETQGYKETEKANGLPRVLRNSDRDPEERRKVRPNAEIMAAIVTWPKATGEKISEISRDLIGPSRALFLSHAPSLASRPPNISNFIKNVSHESHDTTGWAIWSDSWVGSTLNLAVPPPAWCLFGLIGNWQNWLSKWNILDESQPIPTF